MWDTMRWLTVKPFGEIETKFDTGNIKCISVLHAEDIKINGKKITFTLNGKTITRLIDKNTRQRTGGGTDARVVVQLDTELMAKFSSVHVRQLDDRSDMGTDVLLNRFDDENNECHGRSSEEFRNNNKKGD